MRILVLVVSIVSLCISDRCLACLWDYDTLAMERQRFPEAHELIAGHFARNSTAYYEWRIADRTAKPTDQRTPGDYDDIAVAYDKLRQHDKAIETIREKTERWPDRGRYESEANLGTFHIHAGRYEEGLKHIVVAIEINPEAHFGREIYQKLLVEYLIESRPGDDQLPINVDQHGADVLGSNGFASFVLQRRKGSSENEFEEVQAAAKGIMGMMRFGRHDSPILLEALGDLLLSDSYRNDSKMLAARAYLKASQVVDDEVASTAYREKARFALDMQYGWELSQLEEDLDSEVEQGNDLFQRISADERAWMAAGINIDGEFANQYRDLPALSLTRPRWSHVEPMKMVAFVVLLVMAIVVAAFVFAVAILVRRSRRDRNAAAG